MKSIQKTNELALHFVVNREGMPRNLEICDLRLETEQKTNFRKNAKSKDKNDPLSHSKDGSAHTAGVGPLCKQK